LGGAGWVAGFGMIFMMAVNTAIYKLFTGNGKVDADTNEPNAELSE
jgi:hypothetical protein